MAKKKKQINSKELDIVAHMKAINSKNRSNSDKYNVNQDLAAVLEEVLSKITQTTNLNKRNVKPISILQCVPVWKNIVNQLVGNYPHINNSLKDTFAELFIKLAESIQNSNNDELQDILNNSQYRR